MASIDQRVVAMKFDNAKFEAGVAKTMATLTKLDASLKKMSAATGLQDIEKAANKITLAHPMSLLDKLKARLFGAGQGAAEGLGEIDRAGNKVTLSAPMSALDKLKTRLFGAGQGATEGMADIENAGNKVTLSAPMAALDKLKTRLFGAGHGAPEGMTDIENAGNKVTLEAPIRALDKVRSSVADVGRHAADGFNEIEKSGNRVTFSGFTRAIGGVISQLNVLEIAAGTAIGNIATQQFAKIGAFAKGFTFGPILAGLHEYETNLKSIQTVQANTDRPLTEINASLSELNRYSDQTIYNFSEMARNIGTFTAAGVDLKTATSSIKGIANMAALSGSSSQQAATAMYQLSQAISSGRVSLQDWNSVVNAGMGGKKLQTALATTAVAMGEIGASSVKISGPMKKLTIDGQSFRESIMAKPGQQSWLSSEILVNTLATLDGRFSKAALSAELTKDGLKKYTAAQIEASIADSRASLEKKNGVKYTDEQFKALMKLSDASFKSATEVKTLAQVFDVAKETIGSGWSASFQSIFGNLTEAKKTFTALSGAINGFINANALARNTALHDWKELGGRTALIDGIKNAFQALGAIIKPIGEAFREIFPRKTGKDLADMTKTFRDFTESLKIGPETAENLKRSFKGFFAVLDIGKQIVSGIFSVIKDLFGAASDGSGGFLEITAAIGDWLVKADEAIKNGSGLTKFFDGLGTVLSAPIRLLGNLGEAISSIFGGEKATGAAGYSSSIDKLGESLSPMAKLADAAKTAWQGFLDVLGRIGDVFRPVLDVFGDFGNQIGDAIARSDFSSVFDIVQTTLIAGLLLTVKKALGSGLNINIGGAGMLDSLTKTFGTLNKSLVAMQNNIRADTLFKISSAIALLSAAVLGLSLIDPAKLASSMTAISVGFGQLLAAVALLGKVAGTLKTGLVLVPAMAASMILVATAMDVLAIAILALSQLSWEELAKGLSGVAGGLVAMGLGVRLIPPSVFLIGPALLPLAVALNILAVAVKIFGTMDWNELAKGLVGVGGALTAIGIGTKLIGPSILLVGPGLIAVATALTILSGAVLIFGSMDLATLGKGMLGIAGSLIAIGVAISLIPPTVALQGAGLILVGIGLSSIAAAVALMGNMNMSTLAKGIGAIGVSLVVLAAGLTLMIAALPGAVALMGAAAAFAVLAPVLGILGNMDIGTIAKGLGAMAATIVVLSIAGAVAAPGLLGLGAALIALGAGIAISSAGVYLLAKGLVLLGSDGAKGVAVMVAALTGLVAIIPKVIISFVKGLVDIAAEMAKLAPELVKSMVKIVNSLLDVIIQIAPKIALAAIGLITAFLTVLNEKGADIFEAGWQILIAFLKGIADHIGEVTITALSIVTNFLETMASKLPDIITSGTTALLKFLEGIANNLPQVIASAAKVIVSFLSGITNSLPSVIASAANVITKFLGSVADQLPDVIASGAKIIVKFLEGVASNIKDVIDAAVKVAAAFIRGIAGAAVKLGQAGFDAVIDVIEGVSKAIADPENAKKLTDAGLGLGSAIIRGMVNVISSAGSTIGEALLGLIPGPLRGAAKGVLGLAGKIRSAVIPAGQALVDGVTTPLRTADITSATDALIYQLNATLNRIPKMLENILDLDPVITPVLDLSKVQEEAKKLPGMLNVFPITAATSYQQASSIATAEETSQADRIAAATQAVTQFNYEQNNYSPESLTPTEVYRQTKNQLAQAKNALGLAS